MVSGPCFAGRSPFATRISGRTFPVHAPVTMPPHATESAFLLGAGASHGDEVAVTEVDRTGRATVG
jgi:hypothetical protein